MKRTILLLSLFLLIASVPVFAVTEAELYNSMVSCSPAIRSAREQVSQALLDVKDAKAGFTPTLDLLVTGSYIANPIDPIRINPGDYANTSIYGLSNDYITIYQGQESMYYQFSLELTQPIFTWGKLSNAVKLYQAIYEARVLQLEDAIKQTETELATRIAALYYLLQIQDVLDVQVGISERLVSLADNARDNGMMLATEALGVKVQARQLDVARSRIDQQILLMMTEIGNLTGMTDLEASDIEFDEAALQARLDSLMETDYSSLLSKALSDSRTTFSLLGKLVSIAELSRDIAGASVNWKPDVALVVDADFSGSRFPFVETDWYGKDDWNATVTVAIKTTVLDGGKAVRNVSRTNSDVSQANIDIQSAKAKVRSALDENWTNLSVCQAQIDYQEALQEQLLEQASVNLKLLDSGYGSEADYLQALLEANNCTLELLQSRIDLASAVYTLLYLEGESAFR